MLTSQQRQTIKQLRDYLDRILLIDSGEKMPATEASKLLTDEYGYNFAGSAGYQRFLRRLKRKYSGCYTLSESGAYQVSVNRILEIDARSRKDISDG